MNAKEAREITNKALEDINIVQTVYAQTIKWIEWSAKQGKCYIEFDKAVESNQMGVRLCIKYMLLADGYKIIEKNDLGGLWDCHDCICW